jgi:hypothetical protein
MHIQMCTEENMIKSFTDFIKSFRTSSTSDKNRKPTTAKAASGDPEGKHRQLLREMADIIQELLSPAELSDCERPMFPICSAMAFLLAGR